RLLGWGIHRRTVQPIYPPLVAIRSGAFQGASKGCNFYQQIWCSPICMESYIQQFSTAERGFDCRIKRITGGRYSRVLRIRRKITEAGQCCQTTSKQLCTSNLRLDGPHHHRGCIFYSHTLPECKMCSHCRSGILGVLCFAETQRVRHSKQQPEPSIVSCICLTRKM